MKFIASLMIFSYIVSPAFCQDAEEGYPFPSVTVAESEGSLNAGLEISLEQEDLANSDPLADEEPIEPVEKPDPVLTEPLSVTGVVESVVDSEGNEYLVLVVQPMQLTPIFATESYTVKVPYTEMTPVGEAQTKTRVMSKTRQTQRMTASAKSAVMIPLLKSTPCYVLQGAMRFDASQLKVGQHLLVAGSTIEALQVSSEVQKTASRQVELTGISPQLPKYIVALSEKPKSEQSKSLLETLMEASPYRSSTTFFDELKLTDPNKSKDDKKKRFLSKRQAEIAWIKARQDFYANRYNSSEPNLAALIEMDSKEPLVHYFRGIIRFNRGDSDGASMDFANGAELESTRGQTRSVSRDLEPVQGTARQALEEYRRYYRLSLR